MPIQNAPNRGYAEWQRIANYDTAPIFISALFNTAPTQTMTIQDVSRFAYLGGRDLSQTQPSTVTLQWFSDVASSSLLGNRTFQLSPLIQDAAQYRLPNLGPFVTASWSTLTGANLNHTVTLIGTNRSHPLEFIPTNPILLDDQGASLAANQTVTLYPQDYYAGPLAMYFAPSVASDLALEILNASNVWDTFWSQPGATPVAGGSILDTSTVTPAGAWRVQIINTTASAGTFSITLIPSMSGAA